MVAATQKPPKFWNGQVAARTRVPFLKVSSLMLICCAWTKSSRDILHDIFPSQLKVQDYIGTNRFDIMISGDNATPSRCEINVEYRQEWSTLRAWRA